MASQKDQQIGRLGTFAGVFTPSILTILGIILFLRLGYVTGSAGIGRAFIIIAIANLITILTSQSLAAIATNLKVKGGGDYYLISRTLGVEFGGAIGIVLYLAQSVSVAFYCIGFAEALSVILGPETILSPRIIAVMAVSVIFFLAWLGADWATRFQYIVMGLLIAALLSFFLGGIPKWQGETFWNNWSPSGNAVPFWILFGIFFPAVTGFTQGVSMSGDLKDPGRSLPLGTFMAIGFSTVIYLGVIIVFAGVLPNKTLVEDYQAIKQISLYSFLIDAGVIAATLSSAMASFLGGPRILQSLAADRVFPLLNPFAKSSGPTNNPRRAVLLTLFIALIVIMLGQLNLVARIVSMFFLISYGLLNYATWYEAHSESPSFRPRFRWFHKNLSLLGCLVCLMVILALDTAYGLAAIAILSVIYKYIQNKNSPHRWADSGRSHAMRVIRTQLLTTIGEPEHDRDWRPHIIAFTNTSERRVLLLRFAEWIGGNSALITAVKMVEGEKQEVKKQKVAAQKELAITLQENELKIFPLAIAAEDSNQALDVFLQGYGVGPLRANIALCNWSEDATGGLPGLSALKFGHNLRMIFRKGYSLVVFHADPFRTERIHIQDRNERVIDVWWNNDASSRLMLLLAYLMTRHEVWKNATLRLLTTSQDASIDESIEQIGQQLEDARIPALPTIVQDTAPETVITHSSTSDLVFLPFRIKLSMLTDQQGYSFERVLTRLPPVALVMAAHDIDLDAEPEEGGAGQLAEAMDSLHETEKGLTKIEKQLQRSQTQLDSLKQQFHDEEKVLSEEEKGELVQKIADTEGEHEKIFRKSAKERARAEYAAAVVTKLSEQNSSS